MSEEWRKWKHVTQLDPDRKISEKVLDQIMETDTDAIIVAGSQNMNRNNVLEVLRMLKNYDVPVVLKPSNPNCLIYKGVDWIFVQSVFNTDVSKFINGIHVDWIKRDSKEINWDIVVPEALIILNPKCAAAKISKAKPIPKEDVVATAVLAERFFNMPSVYIEYSGTYGDPAIVQAVKENLKKAHLFYGGGVNTKERAEEMSKWATIVVGNTIYENGTMSFTDTLHGTLLQQLREIQGKLHRLKKVREKHAAEAGWRERLETVKQEIRKKKEKK
ncbi:MAG: heptaprenylglyceryl phosphate synthase [Candidatus Aenigmarchaeota archaeon]|nr:heptaprenylglyceryl phosphate synthase [Candidatus Aenigmarchaeota archaeon]